MDQGANTGRKMNQLSGMLIAAVMSCLAQDASADLARVSDQSAFIALVQGKTLSRPLVKLEVSSDGTISGRGARWDIDGNWTWVDGYFCRDLFWGGDSLGQNCQEVQASASHIKFTSDKGTGKSAQFRLK
ncbi:MAG: dihydrodipicolinate reductase [Sulfitobacter sp.]